MAFDESRNHSQPFDVYNFCPVTDQTVDFPIAADSDDSIANDRNGLCFGKGFIDREDIAVSEHQVGIAARLIALPTAGAEQESTNGC